METQDTTNISSSRTIAPEDIRASMYVAIASVLDEWVVTQHDAPAGSPHAVVARVRLLPLGELEPLKVKAVCLPFVLVTSPIRGARMLDVRQHELVALPDEFAQQAKRALKHKRCSCRKKHSPNK